MRLEFEELSLLYSRKVAPEVKLQPTSCTLREEQPEVTSINRNMNVNLIDFIAMNHPCA